MVSPTESYRTRDPLLVVGEVEDWEGHSPEVLPEMPDHLVQLREQGLDGIEDQDLLGQRYGSVRMIDDYEKNGYVVFRDFLNGSELQGLREVITNFHHSWIRENVRFYAEKAVNSAYLTSRKHLKDFERETLFKFIGSARLMKVVNSVMGGRSAFMNTQLFFDPVNKDQRNYWHRDPQYHLSLEEQKNALLGANVVHFRVSLVDEPGLELIPGTHKRWDSEEELDVRLERRGRKNFDYLSTGVRVTLNSGDLLVFDANIIHRGVYGMDRLSLDILFCDPDPELVKFADESCLPDSEIMERLEKPAAFRNTVAIYEDSVRGKR